MTPRLALVLIVLAWFVPFILGPPILYYGGHAFEAVKQVYVENWWCWWAEGDPKCWALRKSRNIWTPGK